MISTLELKLIWTYCKTQGVNCPDTKGYQQWKLNMYCHMKVCCARFITWGSLSYQLIASSRKNSLHYKSWEWNQTAKPVELMFVALTTGRQRPICPRRGLRPHLSWADSERRRGGSRRAGLRSAANLPSCRERSEPIDVVWLTVRDILFLNQGFCHQNPLLCLDW